MKIKLFFVALLFGMTCAVSQTVPYYPLHVNDRWEFSGKISKLSKAIKDTTMPNGKKYTVVANSDTTIGGVRFERFDGSKIYRFNLVTQEENLWFDFARKQQDTINIIPRLYDTVTIRFVDTLKEVILGKSRKLWRFAIIPPVKIFSDIVDISDSLGIVRYLITNKYFEKDTFKIVGAFIDSQLIRTSYPFIYLPLQIGNWWKFDDDDMLSVAKDTLMPNGKHYSLLSWKYRTPTNKYLRQENHLVLRYNPSSQKEEIEIDMSVPKGQIWDMRVDEQLVPYYLFSSAGMRIEKVFGTERKVYSYGENYIQYPDGWFSWVYADSIGVVQYWSMFFTEVTEAYIKGKSYILTSVNSQSPNTPNKFLLSQNYPNPFNPSTTISFSIPKAGEVELRVFDFLGRNVAILVKEHKNVGSYTIDFNANLLSSGMYFYRIKVGTYTSTKKMLLLK